MGMAVRTYEVKRLQAKSDYQDVWNWIENVTSCHNDTFFDLSTAGQHPDVYSMFIMIVVAKQLTW